MRPPNQRRRKKIYQEIVQTYSYHPSLGDLAVWTGIPQSTIYYYLLVFEREKRLTILNRGQNRIDGSRLRFVPNTSGV